jgi:hypothetical protein
MKLFIQKTLLVVVVIFAAGLAVISAQTPQGEGSKAAVTPSVTVSETVRLRAENAALKAQLLYAQSKEMEKVYADAQKKMQSDFEAAQAILKDAIKDASAEAKVELTFDVAAGKFVPKPAETKGEAK